MFAVSGIIKAFLIRELQFRLMPRIIFTEVVI